MDAKFLKNQRFSKRHNLITKRQLKRAEERKATREAKKQLIVHLNENKNNR